MATTIPLSIIEEGDATLTAEPGEVQTLQIKGPAVKHVLATAIVGQALENALQQRLGGAVEFRAYRVGQELRDAEQAQLESAEAAQPEEITEEEEPND